MTLPREGRSIKRLGVIGDVHAEHRLLDRALDWLAGQNVDAIVCTGDVADGSGDLDVSCRLLDAAQVDCVAGNHDRWLLDDRVRHVPWAHDRECVDESTIEFLRGLPKTRSLDTVAGPLLLCHGVVEDDLGKVWPGTERSRIERHARMDALIDDGHYRYVINGHLHYRVLIDFHDALLINAGTLQGQRGGVAVVDFESSSIAAFEFAAGPGWGVVRVVEHPLGSVGRRVWRSTVEFDARWTPTALYAS